MYMKKSDFPSYHFSFMYMYICLGPFNEDSVSSLTVKNRSNKNVVFKLKSKQPERYVVNPMFGLVEPSGETAISSKNITYTSLLSNEIIHTVNSHYFKPLHCDQCAIKTHFTGTK